MSFIIFLCLINSPNSSFVLILHVLSLSFVRPNIFNAFLSNTISLFFVVSFKTLASQAYVTIGLRILQYIFKRNSFTPLNKIQLSLRRFLRNSCLLDNFLKTSMPNFMNSRQKVWVANTGSKTDWWTIGRADGWTWCPHVAFLITKGNVKLTYILLGETELFTAVRVPVW